MREILRQQMGHNILGGQLRSESSVSVLCRVRHGFRLGLLVWTCVASPLWAAEPADSATLEESYRYWRQGYLLHDYGNYHEAIANFRRSIKAYPTAEAHTYLGWSLSYLGRVDEAIAECKKAIILDPDYGNPYNDIGAYLIQLDKADEAVAWLEKAMGATRYCCYEFPHANMGRIHLMKGQLEEAQRSFDRALSYNPNYLPALQGLRLIEQYGGKAL